MGSLEPVAVDEAFRVFWALYDPRRRVGKILARKAFHKAYESEEWPGFQTVLDSLERFRWVWRHTSEDHYIPHPATWLNRGSYLDEIAWGRLTMFEDERKFGEFRDWWRAEVNRLTEKGRVTP